MPQRSRRFSWGRAAARLLVIGIVLVPVPAPLGCGGGKDCPGPGESCMEQMCCPKSDGSVSFSQTFSYPNGRQTVSSCTCR